MKKVSYEKWHQGIKLQKKIVQSNNFTHRIIFEVLKKYIRIGMNVLDIGCGAGTVCFYLGGKMGLDTLGIDISNTAIGACQKSAYLMGLQGKCQFLSIDFLDTRLRKKFDLVLCCEVIEHIEDDQKALEKIGQLLKDRGILIVSTPLRSAPLKRWGFLDKYDKETGHLRRYNEEILRKMFAKANLNILEIKYAEGVFRNFFFVTKIGKPFAKFIKFFISDLFSLIDSKIFLPVFGPSQIYVVASKKN